MKERMELIHDYFAGELTPRQHRALQAWLKESSEHLDLFVREALMHRLLVDAMAGKKTLDKSLDDLPLPGALWAGEAEPLLGDPLGPPLDSSTSFSTWNGLFPKLGLVLCLVALTAAAVAWVAGPFDRGSLPKTAWNAVRDDPAPETIRKVRDRAVASVEMLGSCAWQGEQGKPPLDGAKATSRVESGRTLRLLDGKARISFDCGAVLTLAGPAVLRVDSNMDATLLGGSVSAVVSQEAIGFLLHTTEMDVRDLGTEFDVHVDPTNGTQVEVVDGKVEADLAKRLGHDKETVRLTQGQYLRAGNKQSVDPENLRIFRGTRIDFDKPNSLDLFTIERSVPSLFQLDHQNGKLLLDATCGSIYARSIRGDNLFLLPISSSADLDVILTVNRFKPQTHIEHIGLVYMADEDNYARIIYAVGAKENYLKFTVEKGGVPFGEIEEPIDFGSRPFKFRLTRRGNEVSSWWSVDDGRHWTLRDRGTTPPGAKYVGFYVANSLPKGATGSRAWIERLEVECSE